MKVNAILNTPDAYRQSQFYAGTHLALYKKAPSKTLKLNVPEENSEIYVQHSVGPSRKEKHFLQKRQQHATLEEHFQRLSYKNGVHYSVNLLQQSTQNKQY